MATTYAKTRYPGIRKRFNGDGSVSYAIQVRLKGFPPVSETRGRLKNAVQRRDEIKRELRDGLRPGRGRRMVSEMVQRYLASPAWADLQATTQKTRRNRLDWWLARIGDLHIVAVTPELVAEYRDALRAGDSPSGDRVSGPTSNRYVGALSSVFRWAQGDLRSWLAHGNPCRGIYRAKEHPPRTRILSDEEYRRLEPLLRKSSSANLYSLFVAALSSGAREGELLSLEWTDDHDLERGTWRLRRGKSGDARVLFFSGEALEALRRLARVPHTSKKVFVGRNGRASFPRRAWEKALEDAEIEDFRFHDLRHTAITWQAMTGVSVPWLQLFSGHKTSAQLDKYVHLAQTRSSEIAGLYQRSVDKLV